MGVAASILVSPGGSRRYEVLSSVETDTDEPASVLTVSCPLEASTAVTAPMRCARAPPP
jgi:hypothetical protein